MDGLWVLLLLLLAAALPLILVYFWFRGIRFPLSLPWFLLFVLAGALALPAAALMQHFFPPIFGPGRSSLGTVFLEFFLRIALTEETGRLLLLLLFFRLKALVPTGPVGPADPVEAASPPVFGAAAGLLAGLGFALVENAYYGAADIGITLVRAFTAAPLHGACGSRVGFALMILKKSPGRALGRFFLAAAIHGMYNFMIISPGMPAVFPILVALTAFAASVQLIHRG